jgi:transposase-like protein
MRSTTPLYARGMTTRDIQSFLCEKYDIDVSPEFISSVYESLSAGVQEWRAKPPRMTIQSVC